MRKCLFCEEPANNKEHIWPKWILERVKPNSVLHGMIAGKQDFFIKNTVLKIMCVCKGCNNGWMSDLETIGTPVIGKMLEGKSFNLDQKSQNIASLWAIKTAMVLESVSVKSRKLFYTEEERYGLHARAVMPELTVIWIGKYEGRSLGSWGRDLWNLPENVPPLVHSYCTTIVVGHLAIQILTSRVPPEHRNRPITINLNDAPWEQLLSPIWPLRDTVAWPPALTFSGGGAPVISELAYRWNPQSISL